MLALSGKPPKNFSVPKRVSSVSGTSTPGGIGVSYLYCCAFVENVENQISVKAESIILADRMISAPCNHPEASYAYEAGPPTLTWVKAAMRWTCRLWVTSSPFSKAARCLLPQERTHRLCPAIGPCYANASITR